MNNKEHRAVFLVFFLAESYNKNIVNIANYFDLRRFYALSVMTSEPPELPNFHGYRQLVIF